VAKWLADWLAGRLHGWLDERPGLRTPSLAQTAAATDADRQTDRPPQHKQHTFIAYYVVRNLLSYTYVFFPLKKNWLDYISIGFSFHCHCRFILSQFDEFFFTSEFWRKKTREIVTWYHSGEVIRKFVLTCRLNNAMFVFYNFSVCLCLLIWPCPAHYAQPQSRRRRAATSIWSTHTPWKSYQYEKDINCQSSAHNN